MLYLPAIICLSSWLIPATVYSTGGGKVALTMPPILAAVNTATVVSAGQTWMARNLGASRVATSAVDSEAYGDLFQWGRLPDGHESRTSDNTSTNSTSDVPGHDKFIKEDRSPYDWRTPQNDALWQGVSGRNNPCPAGFRLPTRTELETERASLGSNDTAGAFASPLKLVAAGFRNRFDGTLNYEGINGDYWSSTVNGTGSLGMGLSSDGAEIYSYDRAYGLSVRCIKD